MKLFSFLPPVAGCKPSGMDFEPTESDLEQVVDATRADMGLPPPAMKAEEGIAIMEARITELTQLKRSILDHWAASVPGSVEDAAFEKEITAVSLQLHEAYARRDEYLTQFKGLN